MSTLDSNKKPADAAFDTTIAGARELIARRRTQMKLKDDPLKDYRAALRSEVREQELAALVNEVAQLRAEANEHHATRCVQHNEIITVMKAVGPVLPKPTPKSVLTPEALLNQGVGSHSRTLTLPPLPAVGAPQETIPEGFELVSNAYLDVEEIANMLSAAIVRRKPLQCKVRVVYNEKAQRELHYLAPGVYGLNENMRSACLVQFTDDADLGPHLKGTYVEYGKVVDMSPEQINRVALETLNVIRKLWTASKDEV